MTLAGKLDRLRSRVAPQRSSDPLAVRLEELRQRRGVADRRTPVGDLVRATGAKRLADGVLLCCTDYALSNPGGKLTELPEVCDLDSPDWVYLDTETTGLSGGVGNLAFLVGAARYRYQRVLEVRQYLLEGFSGEQTMLTDLIDWIGGQAVLVSYNGKCFDLPLLDARRRLHRIDVDLGALRHLDLMHSVRRAFRGHWSDCRLQTAERRLLDLQRVDDLPGAEAPPAWRAWLDSGRTTQLGRVMQHNFQDVVSLAQLHGALPAEYAGVRQAGRNHAAIGMAWQHAGRPHLARQVWERADGFLDDRGRLQLAALHRRQGRWLQAEAIWLDLHARGDPSAASELSKYYEHRRRDFRKAMHFAACCRADERAVRTARLRAKIERDPQLSLLQPMAAITA